MTTIHTAVIGAGFIGPVHVEGLLRAGIPVVGILGVRPEESKTSAKRLGLKKAYDHFQQVLDDPDVQVVHIATPNRLHFDMAKKALEAGKHVLCEKPLAMTSAESAELVRIARKTGLAAGVNYNLRYYPLNVEAADRVRKGEVGPIFSVCGSYVQDWLLYPTDYNWRVLAEEGGQLRAVADIGTHWLDLIHAITGMEAEEICADLSTVHPVRQRPIGEVQTFKGKEDRTEIKREPVSINTEDYGCIMIRFRGGARGCLWVSQVTAGRKNCLRYELSGANETLAWCSEQPNEMWIGHRERPNELLLRDPSLVGDAARKFIHYPGGHNEGFPDTFKQCFRAFYDAIRSGNPTAATYPSFADGHREIVLCEAILQSHRLRSWVQVQGVQV
jgi:predicted dehydrogenase